MPTTFAEPIAVSLKTEGTNAYLEVQLFVGFMYLAAFISSMNVTIPQNAALILTES